MTSASYCRVCRGKFLLRPGDSLCEVCNSIWRVQNLVVGPRFPAVLGQRAIRALSRCHADLLVEADEFFNNVPSHLLPAAFGSTGSGPSAPETAPPPAEPATTTTVPAAGTVNPSPGQGEAPAPDSHREPDEEVKPKDKKRSDKERKKDKHRKKDKDREDHHSHGEGGKEKKKHKREKESKSPEKELEADTPPASPTAGSAPSAPAHPVTAADLRRATASGPVELLEEEEEEESAGETEASKSPLVRRSSAEGPNRPRSPSNPPLAGRGSRPTPEPREGRGSHRFYVSGLTAKSKAQKWKNKGKKKRERQQRRRRDREEEGGN